MISEAPQEIKKKSKKPRRLYDLADFIVIKRKDKKSQKIVTKKLKKLEPKRGKVRKKKKSTLKKKILQARTDRRKIEETSVDPVEEIVEKVEILEIVEEKKHSNKFRDYCDHFLTPEIKEISIKIIKDLFRFQENKFSQNPVKAKANRRYVVGFNEVRKFLKVEKLKLIFIATDLEKNVEVENLVEEIKNLAVQLKTFYCFGLPRRKIGYLLMKKVPVSIVGVFDFQGTQENVNSLISLVESERIKFKEEGITIKI